MTRILLNAIAVRGGGPESFLLGLLPELTNIATDIEFDLLVSEEREHLYRDRWERLRVLPVDARTFGSLPRRLGYEHVKVPRLIRRGHYDVYFRADEMVAPAVKACGVPILSVFHATLPFLLPQELGDSRAKLAYERLSKNVSMRLSDVVVAVSNHERAEICGLFPFASAKTKVIHHGINHDLFKPSPDPGAAPLSDRGISKYLLCVSDHHAHKNYVRLIRGYAKLQREAEIEEHLVIVGRSKNHREDDRIEHAIAEEAVENKVLLLDYIDHEQLPAIYRAATAYVFPSVVETFGFTPLEAMACGVPVAASEFSAIPEVCGDAAEYFDPFDSEDITRACRVVVCDEQARDRFSRLGLEHASRFAWSKAARKYLKLIGDLTRSDGTFV